MPVTSNSTLLACAIAAFVTAKLISWHRRIRDLPPGPPKIPLLDNLHNMPPSMDSLKYAALAEQYGSDVIHLSALGHSLVILHSFEAAQDLFEKKSAIYSSRPYSTMFTELSGLGRLMLLQEYNDEWKSSRRLFNKHFGVGASKEVYQPRAVFYIRRLLSQLIEDPADFRQRIRHCVGSISISMAYGLPVQPLHDPYIDLAERVNVAGVEIFMDQWLVDVVPSLKYLPDWFPGTGFKQIARSLRNLLERATNTLFEEAKNKLQEETFRTPSFISNGLPDLEDSANIEEDTLNLKNVAAQVYLAAADTTTSAVATFFLAMVCYPEVQTKLQRELDAALRGRLPIYEDIETLPYLNAVILEVFRWKTITPVGNPHSTTEDDVYNGYFIPKGSIILANQWAMCNDPRVYRAPSEFKPERFLKNGKIDESVRSPLDIVFGFGRRRCPGRHIAHSTLMLLAASVLSVFNLEKKLDEKGNVMEPSRECDMTAISHPKEFACDIKPRSKQAKELVAAWVNTEGDNPP